MTDPTVLSDHNIAHRRPLLVANGNRSGSGAASDFTISEAVAMGLALEKLERPKAKERQIEAGKVHGRGKIASENFTEAIDTGTTRDKVGAAIGMSGPTYQRADAVISFGSSTDSITCRQTSAACSSDSRRPSWATWLSRAGKMTKFFVISSDL